MWNEAAKWKRGGWGRRSQSHISTSGTGPLYLNPLQQEIDTFNSSRWDKAAPFLFPILTILPTSISIQFFCNVVRRTGTRLCPLRTCQEMGEVRHKTCCLKRGSFAFSHRFELFSSYVQNRRSHQCPLQCFVHAVDWRYTRRVTPKRDGTQRVWNGWITCRIQTMASSHLARSVFTDLRSEFKPHEI